MKFFNVKNPFSDKKEKKKKKKKEKIKNSNRNILHEQQQSMTYDNESDKIERFKVEIHKIEKENESLKSEIGNLQNEIIIKNQSLKDNENELITYKENFENVRRTVIDLKNDKQKYADQIAAFEELKQRYNEQNNKFADQNNKFVELKQKYADQNNDFEELKQKYNNQNNDFEELKQKYDNQNYKFEELNQKYNDQSHDFEELKLERKNQNSKFEELNRKYNNQNDNFDELKQKYEDQNDNFQELKRKRDEQIVAFEILKQKYKDQNDDFEELKQKYEDQNLAFEELKQKYKEQNIDLDKLKQQKDYLESQYNKSEQQLKEKVSQIKSLKRKNNDLEDEASKYQSALGIATNFDFDVDDPNNNVKLSQDILSLQDILENYVTNLKPKIDVNINEAKKLLDKYGCRSKISEEEPNKPLIKAVLQRYVLEEILVQADFYFKNFKDSPKDHYIESKIADRTTTLTGLMEKFYNNRLGDDEITRISPIRLRQQVYTALGTRGFNNIRKIDGEISKHDSIDIISNHINKMINKYRIISDIGKKRYVNALAEDLVRNVIRIFYFRLRIQEPMAQYRWFENDEKINKSCMKGSWDEDEIEEMVVEVCSFPMIYKPEDDGDKICTPAKVFPIHIMKEQSLGEKLMDIGMSFSKFINFNYSSNSSNGDSNTTKFSESDEYDSDQTNIAEPDYLSHDKTVNDQVIVY